jgi:maltoporin
MKQKSTSLFLSSLFIVIILFTPMYGIAGMTHKVGTTGYFRLATAISDDSSQEVFIAPGAGGKYRLGNENDNYTEVAVTDTIKLDNVEDSPIFNVLGMVSITGTQNEQWDNLNNIDQLYIEAEKLPGFGGAKIWAGRRYYDRHDIHLNDYFFLNTMQGADVAFGITDINMGFGKLALAYGRDKETVNDEIMQNGIDLRLSDIKVNPNGNLMLWGYYTYSDETDTIKGATGYAAGIMHKQTDFLGGYNKFMVQYGSGLAKRAGARFVLADNDIANLTTDDQVSDLEEAKTFRVVNHTLIEMSPRWSMMIGAVYETKDSKDFNNVDQTWLSLGVRPIFYINDYFRIPVEIGYDQVNDDAADTDGYLLKTTLAAEFALSRGFWSRPVLRFFWTNATWSDDFKGQIGGSTFADDTSGYSIGTQIEYWW